ncbi:hypothetical protein Emtol_0964 [Emticicia oligotrophica DSM 17448]|uniref:Lipoprotein n=1 Tax=Emticicia oligotrophica (strain DSM 17448 / CIP 109782 / MTCC 6937 / GPTSA100-15) TaxID=929562 RepID=A0ABM5MY96_EMTOG|nr:hypothetical protein [Emticicia oligotrophica]AFK02115.1 hypothetical protein Emtol_0964 [Emticicia oligotrophica DSM 17448]
MRILLLFFSVVMIACQNNNKVSKYYSESERDTLLTNIITYVYVKPPYASNATRFEPQFRKYYVQNLPKFSLENYFITPDSTHYFFLIRPVGNTLKYRRGVVGKFRLKQGTLMPVDFEEIINTPHLEEALVKERGAFLFKELVKNGNLDKYLGMKHYIEWPDSMLVYDKKINEWVGVKSIVKEQDSTKIEK